MNILYAILLLFFTFSYLKGRQFYEKQNRVAFPKTANLSLCKIDTITGSFLFEKSDNIYEVDDMILHSPLLIKNRPEGNIISAYKEGVYFLKGNPLPNTVIKELIKCNLSESPITVIRSSPNPLRVKLESLPSTDEIVKIDNETYSYKKSALKLAFIHLGNLPISIRNLSKGKSNQIMRKEVPVYYVIDIL